MRINSNIPALNAFRQLGINQQAQKNAMTKLSSGLRINKAADDAAGLAISEKMHAQIKGLNQASRNAQDGISLIQTAEGGLNETHSILHRMRELSVQAANDTYVIEDRQEIQKEINQLTEEVDRIANTTEFNTQKLLNRGAVAGAGEAINETFNNIITGINDNGWLSVPEDMITNYFGLSGQNHNLSVEFTEDPGDNTLAYVQSSTGTTDQKLVINVGKLAPSEGVDGENTETFMLTDRVLAHEMVHAVMNSDFGANKTHEMQKWFKEGSAELLQGADERLKGVIYDGSGGIDDTDLGDLVSRATDLLNGAAWNGDSYDYAASYVIMKFADYRADNNTSDIKNIMSDVKSGVGSSAGDIAVENAIANQTGHTGNFAAFVSEFSTGAANYVKSQMNLDMTQTAENDVGSIAGIDHGGSALNSADVINNASATTVSNNFNITIEQNTISSNLQIASFTFQIGAKQGQSVTLEMEDMRSSALGIAGGDPCFRTNG